MRTLALTLAFAAVAGAAAAQPVPGSPRDFSGVWKITGDHSTVRTVEGRPPPMLKPAADKYAAAVRARGAGRPADPIQRCLPHGLPRLLFTNYPFEVLQEDKQVTFVHEVHHMPRMVYLDAPMPSAETLDTFYMNYMGFSSGRWEGDTLVVESKGFNDITTIDRSGIPHSSALSVSERIRKIDPDTLENVITVTDPQTFTRPWSTRVVYRRQPATRIGQYVCTDVNPEAQEK